MHHLLLAHGKAVEVFRQGGYPGEIGIVLDIEHNLPASDAPADQEACQRYRENHSGIALEPLLKGRYPQAVLDWAGRSAPVIQDGDLAQISRPIDFLGLNYYNAVEVGNDLDGGFLKCRAAHITLPMHGFTEMGWGIYPHGMLAMLQDVQSQAPGLKLFITENGCAAVDHPDARWFCSRLGPRPLFARSISRLPTRRSRLALTCGAISIGA